MKWNSRQVLVIVAAVVLIAAAGIFFLVSRPTNVDLASGGGDAAGGGGTPTAELMVAGPLGEMGLGDPKAPNTVIEYASMTCPHCERFHRDVYPEFKKKYVDTGKAYFIFREYPLDPLATSAIMLARCGPKDRYFPMVDLLFDHQADWAYVQDPKAALINLVKQAGITEADFNTCLTNQSVLDGVNWVKNRATEKFGVDSTPTFFFNGVKHAGENLAGGDRQDTRRLGRRRPCGGATVAPPAQQELAFEIHAAASPRLQVLRRADGIPIEPGLTGVVGPNGCGKSNLVEALRWVMGESSYKNMRASGMDDVIFPGSGNRPARNTAEVSLAVDNGDRQAPVAFNDPRRSR